MEYYLISPSIRKLVRATRNASSAMPLVGKSVNELDKYFSAILLEKMNKPRAETTSRIRKKKMGSLESRPSGRAVKERLQHRRKSYIYQKGYSKIRDCRRRGTPDLLMEKHFIPQNNKKDALSNTRTPIIPQRETYVAKSEQCKSMTNQEGTTFLIPCHPHYHSQLNQ